MVSNRHTSNTDEWGTPPELFALLDEEFRKETGGLGFTLDAAASAKNRKVDRYFSKEDDALNQSWETEGAVWLNPPYSRGLLCKFFAKAHEESRRHGLTVVMIVPPRTSTAYWHDHALECSEIRMIRGRVGFIREDGYQNAAPADSVLVIFRGGKNAHVYSSRPRITKMKRPTRKKGAN